METAKENLKEGIGRRRSDRIEVNIPVEVRGLGTDGQEFWETTRTQRVSRHGASIYCHEVLALEQDITIRKLENGREGEFRVVGVLGKEGDEYVYGVALQPPDFEMWDIEFPPLTDAEQAASRVLLECAKCRSMEVSHLDEVETEVFRAVGYLARRCKRCSGSTIWKAASNAPEPEPKPLDLDSLREASAGTVDQRRHPRIRIQLTAAIRRLGARDETVETVDLSRGGLSFKTVAVFDLGERVEVATHYRPGQPVIFIPAKVVYSRAIGDTMRRRYGVQYLAESRGDVVR